MQAVSELNDMGCAGVADVPAELGLVALTGRERTEVVAPAVSLCRQCDASSSTTASKPGVEGDCLLEPSGDRAVGLAWPE
jgi:hypothetical protein